MRRAGSGTHTVLRIAIAVVFLLAVVGVVAFGYYDRFVAPTRVLAARVGDTRYTQGDLVDRMRMLQADARAVGQPFDLGRTPFEVLNNMGEAEIIRRFASEYNIHVTPDDVDSGLRLRFFPSVPQGQEAVPGQVEQEYKDRYRRFLDESHLSSREYDRIVEETIYRSRLREKLGEQVPVVAEQVEVHWIQLDSLGGLPTLGQTQALQPEEVLKRLETVDFEDVARQASVRGRYSNEEGYVGWVPRGAFPRLDPALFGSEDTPALAHHKVSSPITTEEATYILKVTAGPEARTISDVMRERLKDQALEAWLLARKDEGVREKWLEMKFDSELYAWVIKQIKQTEGPATPVAGG